MPRTDRRLLAALIASLALHALPLLPALILSSEKPSTAGATLTAELRPPPAPVPQAVPLSLPEPTQPAAPPKPDPGIRPKPLSPSPMPKNWMQVVREHLKDLQTSGQFYPPEAIARGLQGDALVLLVVDEAGKVVAARIEESSGHPLLDDAALRAVRSLTSLPADAPRQTLLPVRFRLR